MFTHYLPLRHFQEKYYQSKKACTIQNCHRRKIFLGKVAGKESALKLKLVLPKGISPSLK